MRVYTEPLPRLWARVHGLMENVGGKILANRPLAGLGGRWIARHDAADGEKRRGLFDQELWTRRKAKTRSKWKNKKRRSKSISEPVKPQIWLTLVWHLGLKLPWCWRTGPSTASERSHLTDMLQTVDFPKDTLFCGDAGFVGYDFWKSILDHGHSFLIRVGANVRLLKNLGSARKRRCGLSLAGQRRPQEAIAACLATPQFPRSARQGLSGDECLVGA